jgi:benzoyl-CoA reductase subunit A
MQLDYSVGVDLGSTTTKAVLLDRAGRILGRGITNSRSNYDVACKVAMGEGINNTRFTLVESELDKQGKDEKEKRILLGKLRRSFKKQQYLSQLRTLREELEKAHAATSKDEEVLATVHAITSKMAEDATALFRPGAPRKSDFFRDLAGGRYHELAEEQARDRGVDFDVLVGLFDKAILEAENTPAPEGEFQLHAHAALAEAGNDDPALTQAVENVAATELTQVASVGTGYGRARLPFGKKEIRSEILCHGLGAHAMFPGTRTVLDIGGQDTKGIQVDPEGIVTSFQMNDRCAAGCGRYLGYIADEMNLGLHQLGPLASKSTRHVKINSTCTVFAGAELRERLSLGEKREDILAGLHRAIILRAMSILARSGGVTDEFTFTGGVANNSAAVDSLKKLIVENYGEVQVNISPDSIYTGALGAAIFALRSTQRDAEEAEETDG